MQYNTLKSYKSIKKHINNASIYSISHWSISFACSKLSPQNDFSALKPAQTVGRSGLKYIAQFMFSSRWMQGVFAAFPSGIPGIGELIDG